MQISQVRKSTTSFKTHLKGQHTFGSFIPDITHLKRKHTFAILAHLYEKQSTNKVFDLSLSSFHALFIVGLGY